ncbi:MULTISPECIES: YIP1 family protein [unclassified Streptomyces]|uniref:YIP1 family protein n=1 Tax=unclassified Streptomyces TaxID=2593676 RepID=UPI00224FF4C9|nr:MULTISPECIES: YIP1 family protein [unclassified Streptomyces]MCX5049809.1 YIP1 family protein [Streptomyces sp. NBC_00474]
MSQLGRKAGPEPPGPARHSAGPGTFEGVAGFRIGRGARNNGAPQTRPQQRPYGQQAPQGPSYGYPPAPQPHPGQQRHGNSGGQWPQGSGGGYGEPEYFGDGGGYTPQGTPDPYAANNPGHTAAFSVGEDPYSQGGTYRAGSTTAAPAGPRLHWKDLLRGIVLSPAPTFLQMRDYTMWGPALIVTFLYGLLAVFGFDGARHDAITATLANAVPIVLTTAVALVISSFVLGVVTHTLARQLGGDGAWQPTVGLSMLIMSLTDAPRLVFAMFFGGNATFVQALGWATWVAAGALLTMMVSRSHDLPWPKALGASAIQLIALLSIVKLGTF